MNVEMLAPGVACVRLRGEHDLVTRAGVVKALASAGEQANVVVDLTECAFVDSAVIAALVHAGRRLGEDGGRFELVIPPGPGEVRRAAELTALPGVLRVHETRAEALAAFGPQEHTIQIRDLRARFGDDETRAAECTCGWRGQVYSGHQTAARDARREGMVHVERQRGDRPR